MKTSVRSKNLKVIRNSKVSKDCYVMVFKGDDFSDCKLGQFINIQIESKTLRRPISISEVTQEYLTIIYKVVGEGTQILSKYEFGQEVNVLYPLGEGFKDVEEDNILLIGGGIGIAPLIGYYNHLKVLKKNVHFLAGFRDKHSAIILEEFNYDYISYDDKNISIINYIKDLKFDYYYACGPMGLLNALVNYNQNGQLLLESKMACGFGVCMSCPVKVENGYKKVCTQGPMFYAKELYAKR